MSVKKAAGKPPRFTEEERSAMQDRAQELKAASRPGAAKQEDEAEVLAKIAAMPEHDRLLAERLHALIKARAPELSPKTWYGMPAYARAGQVICFFQSSHKFKTRYATLGFSEKAKLDEGKLWPVAYAVKELTPEEETKIEALIRRAAGE